MDRQTDSLDHLLSARMAKLAELPMEGSIVATVTAQIDQAAKRRRSIAREWVLLAAAAMSALIVLSVLPGIGLAVGEMFGVFLTGLNETLTKLLVSVSQSDTITPFAWLILIVPAGLLITAEW